MRLLWNFHRILNSFQAVLFNDSIHLHNLLVIVFGFGSHPWQHLEVTPSHALMPGGRCSARVRTLHTKHALSLSGPRGLCPSLVAIFICILPFEAAPGLTLVSSLEGNVYHLSLFSPKITPYSFFQ